MADIKLLVDGEEVLNGEEVLKTLIETKAVYINLMQVVVDFLKDRIFNLPAYSCDGREVELKKGGEKDEN